MGRPAHCTCWLMGATAINQYCFLCQPFGCSCHTGVHFCFLKLAVSAAIYIYPPMKKWKSCTICTTFRHKVRMLHSAAVPPGLFEALQGWQHHLCPRLPVKVQWFCYSLIRLMLVPICSNQNVVGLVLHFFFNLSFGKHMEKKHHIPHLSQLQTWIHGESPAHAVEFPQLDLLQEPGAVVFGWELWENGDLSGWKTLRFNLNLHENPSHSYLSSKNPNQE